MRRPGKGGATKHTMNTKTYPRTNDRRTIYLNTVIDNPCIEVGDYTIYNDFVNDPTEFEKNNVLYHYPINKDRLVIGKFCSIACGARFLFNSANHTLGSLANYTFPLFFEEWELDWRTSPQRGTTRATSSSATTYGSVTKRSSWRASGSATAP